MVRALVFALAAFAAADVAWYQRYESGIEHIRHGEPAGARADLESALAAHPEPAAPTTVQLVWFREMCSLNGRTWCEVTC